MRHVAIATAVLLLGCVGDVEDVDDDLLAETEGPLTAEAAFPDRAGRPGTALVYLALAGEPLIEQVDSEELDGTTFYEGDILLTSPRDEESASGDGEREVYGAAVVKAQRWPQGVIPYRPPQLSKTLNARIAAAMSTWTKLTGVRFVKRAAEKDFVFFRSSSGCASYAGRIGGAQPVMLGSICTTGSVTHELGHVLGLYHEQSRANRDKYVTVVWKNILPGKEINFRTYKQMGAEGVDIGSYSFGSLMHYGSYFFSRNGHATLLKRDGTTIKGNRTAPNATDIATVRAMY